MVDRAVVVGGGAVGVSCAYFLQRDGWEVTLVDRGEIGRGCSYGNSCLIVPSHSDPLPGPGVLAQALRWMGKRDSPFYVKPRLDAALAAWAWRFRRSCGAEAAERGYDALLSLSRASLDLFEELLETKEVDFFYRRDGLLHVYLTEEGFSQAAGERDRLLRRGFQARLLSPAESREVEPAVSERIEGGLLIEGDAHGFSYGYVQSLAERLAARGGRVLPGRPVARILAGNGRVRGVLAGAAPGEELPADRVVIAAGSWSPFLGRDLGLRIPMQPAKGYSCTIDRYPGAPSLPVLVKERRVIVTPLGERLRFGGTLELAGYDLGVDEIRYRSVVEGALSVLKEPAPLRNEERWCGLRPLTPDGLPIIDRVAGMDGLLVATGHAMLGFTQSPITGKLVAELARDETPSVPLDAFRLGRF